MRASRAAFPLAWRVAVAIGPGSFTGIRVGLAMARAMGMALAIPWSAFRLWLPLAAPLLSEPRTGIIAAAIDARHGAVYFQLFEASDVRWGCLAAIRREVCARLDWPGSPATPPRCR